MAGRGIDEKLRCSFCNKTQDQVKKLISGPNGIYICDQCVSICSDILDEEFEEEEDDGNPAEDMEINLLKPKEIKEFLEHYYDIGNIIPTWPGANVNRGMAHSMIYLIYIINGMLNLQN